ncbi:MAG TPA: hypothetical protein PLO37_15620 [Candidatus Hydrogenedentes bacterium]|nr:hypothetical protein [Candidatus Hydrogenedentota bacterium]HPG68275.1 hypothetical protein [Candidatus Hydrogenedentota bacterium]
MGDAGDLKDVERFIRSETGQGILAQVRKAFQGRWISDVSFNPDVKGVRATVVFHAGEPVDVLLPDLTLERIQRDHEEVLEEEYYRDYPERRPNADLEKDGHGES